MKASTFLGALTLVILGVCTSFITSAIFGQGPPRQNRQAQVQPPVSKTTITKHTRINSDPRNFNIRTTDDEFVDVMSGPVASTFSLKGMNVSVNNGKIEIFANASMKSRKNNLAFVWAIKVKNITTGTNSLDYIYKTQWFALQPGLIARPAFREVLQLPPATYEVILTLNQIPLGTDINRLKSKNIPDGQVVLREVKTVFVQ